MKSKLLLIMLVGCLAGIVLAGTPITQNDFTVQRRSVENNIANNMLLNTSLVDLTTVNFANSSTIRRDPCDDPPPPPSGNQAILDPPCVDTTDEDPDPPISGTTHKDALPFASGGDYVAKYYMKDASPENYTYIEEQPLVSFDIQARSFVFDLPNVYQVNGNHATYRVDIVEEGAGGNILTHGYFDVYYPAFEEFPEFP